MAKVNDEIHGDLIEHDISIRRITGDCVNRAERRLDRLGADLKALTARIDPFDTDRTDARKRRIAKLEKAARELVREAYSDIAKENQADLRRVARAETEATVEIIRNQLP